MNFHVNYFKYFHIGFLMITKHLKCGTRKQVGNTKNILKLLVQGMNAPQLQEESNSLSSAKKNHRPNYWLQKIHAVKAQLISSQANNRLFRKRFKTLRPTKSNVTITLFRCALSASSISSCFFFKSSFSWKQEIKRGKISSEINK